MKKDYSKLPFIDLSQENLNLACDLLEAESIGNVVIALTNFLKNGDIPNLTKSEMAVFKNWMAVIERKSEPWFKAVECGKKGAEKRWKNKPTEERKEESDVVIPIDTQKPQEMAENGQEIDNIETEKDMGNFVGYLVQKEPMIETRAMPQTTKETVPAALINVLLPFFKGKAWLFNYDDEYFNNIWNSNISLINYASEHNIDKELVRDAWVELKNNRRNLWQTDI